MRSNPPVIVLRGRSIVEQSPVLASVLCEPVHLWSFFENDLCGAISCPLRACPPVYVVCGCLSWTFYAKQPLICHCERILSKQSPVIASLSTCPPVHVVCGCSVWTSFVDVLCEAIYCPCGRLLRTCPPVIVLRGRSMWSNLLSLRVNPWRFADFFAETVKNRLFVHRQFSSSEFSWFLPAL